MQNMLIEVSVIRSNRYRSHDLFVYAMCETLYQYIARAASSHIVERAAGAIKGPSIYFDIL